MIKAAIVDDEPQARKNLNLILNRYCNTDIEIIGEAGNVQEATMLINRDAPDLIFLDIEMGAETGFDLISKYDSPDFSIIFVTAFDQYAIKAIKSCALDYLLKPINIKEVQQAVERVKNLDTTNRRSSLKNLSNILQNSCTTSNSIAIPTMKGYTMVAMESILYLMAQRDYTFIYSTGNPVLCSSTNIGRYEEMLTPHGFFRVHHSYIINREHLRHYIRNEDSQIIMNNNKAIPVSRRKKQAFIEWLNNLVE